MRRLPLAGVVVALLASSCSAAVPGRTVVAAAYPLAYAAQRLAEPGWRVIDLTPPGAEAHDVELSLEDRATIEEADLVLYLGQIGFQPQVEAAVREADGTVVDLRPDLEVSSGRIDPHVWLEPSAFVPIVNQIGEELCPSEGPCSDETTSVRRETFRAEVDGLAQAYLSGLRHCTYHTLIASHEAFGHLEPLGVTQLGLSGAAPEAEPSADRLVEARRLLDAGQAGAVFYEERPDAVRLAETVAADAGVPALPLSTLESRPRQGDYLSVMEDNLESMRTGLGCR